MESFIVLRALWDILLPLHPEWIRIDLDYGFAWYAVGISFCLIIVLTIQADPLTGDRPFWVTRPISWKTLLAGKLLFLFCLVNLPLLVAQSAALTANDLSLWRHGILLFQNQLLVGISVLFVAAIASVTRNLAEFLLTALSLFALFIAVLLAYFRMVHPAPQFQAFWSSAEYFKPLILYAPVLLISSVVLWLQYSKRILNKSTTVLCLLLSLILLRYSLESMALWRPIAQWRAWSAGILLRQSPVSLTIPSDQDRCVHQGLPLRISGVPEGHNILIEKVKFIYLSGDGVADETGWLDGSKIRIKESRDGLLTNGDYSLSTPYDRKFSGPSQESNVTIRAILACRLLGPAVRTTIRPGKMSPVLDQDMRCGIISWHGYEAHACIATGLQKAFLEGQSLKIKSGFNSSIWAVATHDSVVLIPTGKDTNAAILAIPETAWFTTTLDFWNIQLNDCHE